MAPEISKSGDMYYAAPSEGIEQEIIAVLREKPLAPDALKKVMEGRYGYQEKVVHETFLSLLDWRWVLINDDWELTARAEREEPWPY